MSIKFADIKKPETAAAGTVPSAGAPPSRRNAQPAATMPDSQRGHWDKVFLDPEYFDGIAKQPGIVEGAKVSMFGDDYAYRSAMIGYLSETRQVPLDAMQSVYDAEKDSVAQKELGKQTITSKEFFDHTKKRFEVNQQKQDAGRAITEQVIKRALMDSLGGGNNDHYKDTAADIDAHADLFDDKERFQLQQKADEIDMQMRSVTAKYGADAKWIFTALQRQTGTDPSGERAPDALDMAAKFADLPDNQRKAVYQLAGSFAKLQQTDKGFFYQMAESLGRGVGDFTERVPRNYSEAQARGNLRLLESGRPVYKAAGIGGKTLTEADPGRPALTAEEVAAEKATIEKQLRVFKVQRELRELAETDIDPIKTLSSGTFSQIVEEGLYGAARSVPYTAVAAIPYLGGPGVFAGIYSQNYDGIMLENPSLDPDKAALVALASSPIEAALERLKVNTIMGRLPIFGKLVKRFTHPNQRFLTRFMIGATGTIAEQNAQEIIQNSTFPVAQMIAAALDEDMPGYDLRKGLESAPRQLAVQFVALLPLTLMGMGGVYSREVSRGDDYLKSAEAMGMMGADKEQIDRVMAEPTPEGRQAAWKKVFSEIPAEKKAEGAEKIVTEVVNKAVELRETAAPATLPRLEKQGGDYTIVGPDGAVIYRTANQDSAELMLGIAKREAIQKEMAETTAGITETVGYLTAVNEARQRGEDVQQIQAVAGKINAFSEYSANPDSFAALQAAVTAATGDEITEPEQLRAYWLDASNSGALRGGVYRSVIKLFDGADGTKLVRDFAQDNLKRAVAEGRVSMAWVRDQLNQTIPLVQGSNAEVQLSTATDNDVIESFSDIALAYLYGRVKHDQIAPGLRGFLVRMARVVRDIFRRAYNLEKARVAGQLAPEWQALLAESVGIDQQGVVDAARQAAADGRGVDGLTDDERAALVAEMRADAEAEARENAGGLPSATSRAAQQYRGELKILRENAKGGRDLGVKGTSLSRLFKKDAPDMDNLIRDLRAMGFTQLETPSDVFELVEKRIATGKPIYGYQAASMAEVFDSLHYSVRAHHGTPHKINKAFSLDKIGTGEGAQVYGWGLYFAENKNVGEEYRRSLSDWAPVGEDIKPGSPEAIAAAHIAEALDAQSSSPYARAASSARNAMLSPEVEASVMEVLARWEERKVEFGKGNLYTVDIDVEPEDLLDWDKPLSEQSEKVKRALGLSDAEQSRYLEIQAELRALMDAGKLDGKEWNTLQAEARKLREGGKPTPLENAGDYYRRLGADFYHEFDGTPLTIDDLLGETNAAKAKSLKLASLGIPGIRYLDQGSRPANWRILSPKESTSGRWVVGDTMGDKSHYFPDTEQGAKDANALFDSKQTYNYVIFDDSKIKITEENGRPVEAVDATEGASNYSVRSVDGGAEDGRDSSRADNAITRSQQIARDVGASSRAIQAAQPGTSAGDAELQAVRAEGGIPWYDLGPFGTPDTVASEHYIWFKGDKVFKATAYGKFGHSIGKGQGNASPLEYLRRIAATNEAFNDSATIAGKFEDENGELGLIHVQDFIAEDPKNPAKPTPEQIIKLMEEHGFSESPGHSSPFVVWTNDKIGIEATDLHAGNFIVDATGKIVPIDVIAHKYDETKGANYSISSQAQLERVNAALSGLNRGPEGRAAIYERARDKFGKMMENNWGFLYGLKAGGAKDADVRRTKLLQAMGELDAILSVLPPEVRGKVGGFTTLANIGTGDKALADFFIKRINMIDRELERVLRREWGEAATKLFQRAKPQRNQPGQKPKGKFGYEVHDLFRTLEDATELTEEEAIGRVAGLWAEINAGELTPEAEAHKQLEAELLPLFANWAEADAGRMANAVQIGNDVLTRAYRAERERIQKLRNQREMARFDLVQAAGTEGDLPARQAQAMRDNSLPGTWRAWMLNLFNFDQALSYVFGENTRGVPELVNRQRAADNAKTDGIIEKTRKWSDLITKLAGSNLAGQKLVYGMSQQSVEIRYPNTEDGAVYKFSQNELLTITMMWMQPRGREHMEGKLDNTGEPIGKWHYNQEFVNAAEAALTDGARAIRDYLLKEYDAEYQAINAVYRRVFGINLPKEKNYSPLIVNTLISGGQAGVDPVTGAAFAAGARSPGALKSRGGNVAEPRFQDAVQTYMAHMMQMEHWKAFAEFNADMASVLNHRDIRNAIDAKAGTEANKTLGTWLQYFNEGGARDAASHLAITGFFNRMLNRFATTALFGRVSTLALQSTQLAAASAKMPVGAYLSRLGRLLSGNLSWGEAINSPYIQRRIAQMPPQVQLAMQGLNASEPTKIKEAARRLGSLLSGFDGIFTAGTYAMVYDYQRSQGASEEQARAEAERITDEIAQPTRAGARSVYELTATNPLARAAWAFASEARKNFGMSAFAATSRTPRQAAKAVFYVLVLNGLMSSVIRAAFRDLRDDDDEEIFDEKNWRWENFAAALVSEPLYGIPVLGDVAGRAVGQSLGVWQPNGGTFDIGRAVSAVRRSPDTMVDLIEGEADWGEVARDVNAVLAAMGLFNDQIAGAASISNLVKDLFQVADAQLGPEE